MSPRVKNKITELIPYLLITVAALCMLWPQIHSRAFISGLDYYFHMSRTYETAMQIKTGHFSYFLSIFSWDHSARIVNALYGPIGGYVSGLILLLTHSWYRWEIVVSLITLTLSGSLMYHLGRFWHVNGYIDFIVSILYMLSSPISDFVFKQTFTGLGAALVPLTVLLASEVLIKKDIEPLKLAFILILIIEIHLMTFILSMTFLIPSLLLGLAVAKRKRKHLFKHLLEALILTVILSFNVWGGTLEVLGSNLHHMIPTYPGRHLGTQDFNTIMNTYPQTPLSQTPSVIGLAVMLLMVLSAVWWLVNIRHVSYVTDVFMLYGLAYVWASSNWFPWSFVEKHITAAATIIQFPKRLLPMGIVLIYLMTGTFVSRKIGDRAIYKTGWSFAVIALCLVTGWCWRNNYNYLNFKINLYNRPSVIDWVSMHWRVKNNPVQLRNSLRDSHPNRFLRMVSKPVPDYLPTSINYRHSDQYLKLHPYGRIARLFYHHIPYLWNVSGSGGEIIILHSRSNHVRTVPFVKYAHTRVMLNQRAIRPKINQLGAMHLPLKRGYNQLAISYRPNPWFKVGMLISLLTWIGLLFKMFYVKFK